MNRTLFLAFRRDVHSWIQAKRAAGMAIVVGKMLHISFGGEVKRSKKNQATTGRFVSVREGHRKTLIWVARESGPVRKKGGKKKENKKVEERLP